MTVFERQGPGYLATWLEQKGIPPDIAVRKSGIDPDTFWRVYDGSKTLPSFALRIGKSLGMNQEEVQHIGKALERSVWRQKDNGLPKPSAIEMNTKWYTHLETQPAIENDDTGYLDRRKIAALLIKKDQDAAAFFDEHKGILRQAAARPLKPRLEALNLLADLAGERVENITTATYCHQRTDEYRVRPVWRVDITRLEA